MHQLRRLGPRLSCERHICRGRPPPEWNKYIDLNTSSSASPGDRPDDPHAGRRALQGSVLLWVGLNFFLYRILAPSNVPVHVGVSLALGTPFDA